MSRVGTYLPTNARLRLVAVMKRIAATLAIGVLVVGCGLLPEQVQPEQVPLLTGDPEHGGCYSLEIESPLSVDPTYGTGSGPHIVQQGDWVQVVAWRPGFTGRRVGSEVEVLDPQGNVVATTGHTYRLQGGYPPHPSSWPGFPYNIFWACGDVHLMP
jgi:hypothetical protein